jgi:hypothetical protein
MIPKSGKTLAQALLIALLVVAAGGPVLAQDRTTNCRPLAERGRVWADCCNQSFARNPRRAMSRQARMRGIERCVRNRLRHS